MSVVASGARVDGQNVRVPAQPSVVRTATILMVVSAVLTIVEAVSTLQNIGSVDTVDALNKALSMGWAQSANISITTLQDALRVAANVSAVLAAAVGVLAVFAYRGSRQARVGLAVLAVPVLIACLMAGGYAGVGMVVGIPMLWSSTARPWFAAAPAASAVTPVRTLPAGVPAPPAAPVPPMARPPRVTAAGVVAFLLSALASVGGLLGGIGLATLQGRADLRQSVVDRLHAEHVNLSLDDLDRYLTAATVAAAVVAVLGLLGVLSAILVLRGSRRGRIALIVLSSFCAVVSLIAISSVISLIWLVGSLSVIFALGSADAAAWFKQR